jgi:hypothetical protein
MAIYVVVICGEQESPHLHIPIGAHHQFWMVLGQFFPTFSNHEVYSHVGSHVALSENRVSNFFTVGKSIINNLSDITI